MLLNVFISAVHVLIVFPTAPTAAPTHVRVTSFDSTSISLAWEPPPFSDRNGDIVMYHITVTEQESETVSEYTSTSKNYTLTFLHPYYNYNISIAAETVEVGPFTSGLLQKTMESCMFGIEISACLLSVPPQHKDGNTIDGFI